MLSYADMTQLQAVMLMWEAANLLREIAHQVDKAASLSNGDAVRRLRRPHEVAQQRYIRRRDAYYARWENTLPPA